MIEVESLRKSFGKIVALDDISFHVDDGELLGIIGPNGAGKTTAIRIIACILRPDKGKVRVGGLDVTRDPIKVKSMIGYLPEEPNLYERFTARISSSISANYMGFQGMFLIVGSMNSWNLWGWGTGQLIR